MRLFLADVLHSMARAVEGGGHIPERHKTHGPPPPPPKRPNSIRRVWWKD